MNPAIFYTLPVVILLMIVAGISYLIASRTVGQETAQSKLHYYFLLSLFLVPATFLFSFISHTPFGEYAYLIWSLIFVVIVLTPLLTWDWRMRNAGYLEISIAKVTNQKLLLVSGVLMTFFATTQTFSFIREEVANTAGYMNILASLIFLWVSAINFLALSFSRFELRKNGICYMFSIIKWERINYYYWDNLKDNVLTFRLQRRFPFSPKLWSIRIPLDQKANINNILNQHIPIRESYN